MTVRRSPLLALLAIPFAIGACSGLLGVGSRSPGESIQGRTFVSSSVTVGGLARPLVSGTRISLTFGADTLQASAGCNTFGTSYRLDGTTLRISGGASTAMGCDGPRMDQDTWLFGLLGSAPTVALPDAGHLTLTAGTTVITLLDRSIAEPALSLVGRSWTLEAMVSGQTASSLPAGVRASIEFMADGSMTFDSGCNGGGGRYTLGPGAGNGGAPSSTALGGARPRAASGAGPAGSSGTITFSDLLSTLIACREPMATVESAFRAVVRTGVQVTYRIDGSQLTLSLGDLALDFQA